MGMAIISDCGKYRYRLERQSEGAGTTAVIMVNPSTADADEDDATIRKLRGFGKANHWGRIVVGNLFALRATDVRELANENDPRGPDNAKHLGAIFSEADRIVLAWGRKSKIPPALRFVADKVKEQALSSGKPCLRIGQPTKCGQPPHPLMLAYETPLEPVNGD